MFFDILVLSFFETTLLRAPPTFYLWILLQENPIYSSQKIEKNFFLQTVEETITNTQKERPVPC